MKLYQPCKLWTQNRCPKSQASCVYMHSFFCPDKACCKQEYCTLLHYDLDKYGSHSTKRDVNDSKPNDFNPRKKCKLSDIEVVVIEDDEIFRMDSPSPAFDDELCQELEAVGEELDKFTKETMDDNQDGSSSDVVILNEYSASNKRSTHDITENVVDLVESPSKPDSLSNKEESHHLSEKELNPRKEFNNAIPPTTITEDQRTKNSDNKIFEDDSGKVVKESNFETSTNVCDAFSVANAKQDFLLKQKSQLVKSARFLVEQRKVLYTERDNVIKRVMGGTKDQAKVKKILDENSRLTKELSAFLQNVSHKIQNINDEIQGNTKLVADKVPSQIVKEISPTNDTSIDVKGILDRLTNETKGHTIKSSEKEASPQQKTIDLVGFTSTSADKRLIHETGRVSQEDHVGNEHFKDINNKVNTDLNKAVTEGRKDAECEQRGVQSEDSESLKCSLNNTVFCHLDVEVNEKSDTKLEEQTGDVSSLTDKLKTAGDSQACIAQEPTKTMKTSPKDKNTYWCKKCNIFFTSVYGYVEHLESTSHIQNTKTSILGNVDETKEKCVDIEQPQGVEFLHSTTVFFCELCHEIIHNKGEATSHPHQPQHLKKYREYIQNNLSKEIKFMQEKMFALTEYCKKRQIKVSERISGGTSVHSMESAQVDGENE